LDKQTDILKNGLQRKSVASNTVMPEELESMIKKHESKNKNKEKLI
jgi:hypothetical protein